MKIVTLTVGEVGTNCYIALEGEDALLLDPGGEPERIAACLEQLKAVPRAILLTHGHFDHIGGVSYFQRSFGVPVYIHRDDLEMLSDPGKNGGDYFGFPTEPVFGAIPLGSGEKIEVSGMTFTLLHTPGHTPGSCCCLSEKLLFTGDTLFRDGVGRTDLPGGDGVQLLHSLEKLAALPGDYSLYPGHGGSSTLDRERRENPYLGGVR